MQTNSRQFNRGWRLLALLSLAAGLAGGARAAEPVAQSLEARVATAVASPQVTIVHFWAPWCPNCKHELSPSGWAAFIGANPSVHVIFVTVWSDDPGAKALAKAGLGGQPNFTAWHDPNGSRSRTDRTNLFLGLPVPWIPATWIFRDGKLLYALDYGELHFPILQQLTSDATARW